MRGMKTAARLTLALAAMLASLVPVGPGRKALATGSPSAYGGGRIVFSSYRDGWAQIYAMDADGYNQVNLSQNDHDDTGPVVGPDGRIAFISNRDGNHEIYVMEADGSGQTRVTHSEGDEGFLDWSPNGEWLVFDYAQAGGAPTAIVKIRPDGTGRTVLLDSRAEAAQPAWSPDGNRIAFYWEYDSAQTKAGIWTMAPDGSDLEYTEVWAQHPAWSPDGSRLAFVRFHLGGLYGQVGVIGTAGWDREAVTWISPGDAKDSRPVWSPDGRRLLFQSNYTGYNQLYVTRADGSTASNYLNLSASGADDLYADWSSVAPPVAPRVCGSLVAYQSGGAAGDAAIYVYDLESGEATVVTEGEGLRLAGLFLRWVVYQAENRYGSYDIYLYDLDEAKSTRISAPSSRANQNRPFLDAGLVVWRQTSGSADGVTARFYLYDILTGTTGPLELGSYPERYSRYVADRAHVAFVDEWAQLAVYDLETDEVTTLPYSPASLLAVSGGRVAGVEHDNSGDLLVIYGVTPQAREVVANGADGGAALGGDVLTWVTERELFRLHVTEDPAPVKISDDVGAVDASPAQIVWLDGDGGWAAGQIHDIPLYTGLSLPEGDVEVEQPAEASGESALRAQGRWPAWQVARLTRGWAYYVHHHKGSYRSLGRVREGEGIGATLNEIYVPQGEEALLLFRDGSTLRAREHTYLVIEAYHPTPKERIEDIFYSTFNLANVYRLQDAVKSYEANAAALDVGKLGNDLTLIKRLSQDLAKECARAIRSYTSQGRKPPAYLQHVQSALGYSQGAADKLGTVLSVFQLLMRTSKLLMAERYTDQIYEAFLYYFSTISVEETQGGTVLYRPRDPDSQTYFNRADTFFKMMLRDAYIDFNERQWTAGFDWSDGSMLISWPGQSAIRWSKLDIARHFAAVDGDALRSAFLVPLLENSLGWYQDLASCFVPGEASVVLTALASIHKIKSIGLQRGHIQYLRDIERARERTPLTYTLPGAKVHVWGTGLEVTSDGAQTTVRATAEMPVLANDSADAPDAYGITFADGDLTRVQGQADAPVSVPGRESVWPVLVTEIWPNEGSAVAPDELRYRIAFSRPMDTASVLEHGRLRVEAASGSTIFDGPLGDLATTWNESSTEVGLVPAAAPSAGDYVLTLSLPAEVLAVDGARVVGSPFEVEFAVAGEVGPAGGSVRTPSGASLVVPEGALETPQTLQIAAEPVASAPQGWVSVDGLAYRLEPDGIAFSSPAVLSLPAPTGAGQVAVFQQLDEGWERQQSAEASGGQVSVPLLHLSTYAAFYSPGDVVHLPVVLQSATGQ